MHFGSVPTSMLAVFELVKALISENMYGMRSTYVVHRFLKQKVVVRIQKRSSGRKSVHEHVYITICC